MIQLKEKNDYLTELTNQKIQIESKLRGGVEPEVIQDMQRQLQQLTTEFERVITQRIELRRQMIEEF
jgi:hypothetical protein